VHTLNKQHLFSDMFNMPSKTISSWNTYPPDNYRIFAIVTLENITLIYSFKKYLKTHKNKVVGKRKEEKYFLKNLISHYLLIVKEIESTQGIKQLNKESKNLLLKIIENSLTDDIVKKLDVWKYYNKTICKRSRSRRKIYMTCLLFILILLSHYED